MRHYLSEENRKIEVIAFIYNYFDPIRMPLTQSDTIEKPERVGFEPTNSFLLNDFESFAFDLSATSP